MNDKLTISRQTYEAMLDELDELRADTPERQEAAVQEYDSFKNWLIAVLVFVIIGCVFIIAGII